MNRRPKILVVGSFMMDLIASTNRMPESSETVIGLKFRTAPGGKGANQAVQCARLGADVTMVGRVGADSFGEIMLQAVNNSGADVSHVTKDDTEPSGVGHITLEVSETGTRNRITVCPGANFTLSLEHVAWLENEIGNYDLVMLQFEIPMEITEQIAVWAKKKDVPVMVNPAPAAAVSERLLSATSFLSPNEHEAALLSGHKIDVSAGINWEDVQTVSGILRGKGVKELIITMGENGAILANDKGLSSVGSIKTDCIDPTAAGDSFVGSFCTYYAFGLPTKTALELASYTASITVSQMGAMPSLPTLDEVVESLKEHHYNEEVIDMLRGLKNE